MDIFIVGTDTGIGKTVLSWLLMDYLLRNGEDAFYLKPFQTGCRHAYDRDSDARFVYQHIDALKEKNPADSMLFCHTNPKAPLFAARDDGDEIDIQRFYRHLEQLRSRHERLVIEAAGGLLVPVSKEAMVIDLIEESGARPLLAARAGLGTINHTLLSIEALRARNLEPLAVVFINNAATDQAMVLENMQAVQMASDIQVTGVIEEIDDFSTPQLRYDPMLASII